MPHGMPECKRHIAMHDKDGISAYVPSPQPQYYHDSSGGGYARSWVVANIPAILNDDADMKAYLPDGLTSFKRREIVIPGNDGANLIVSELRLGGWMRQHRPVSIDFSICIIGTINHELESGERVVLKPVDHIVQRDTMHRRINASKTEPARLIAISLPCIPFDIAGKELKEIWREDEPGYNPKIKVI